MFDIDFDIDQFLSDLGNNAFQADPIALSPGVESDETMNEQHLDGLEFTEFQNPLPQPDVYSINLSTFHCLMNSSTAVVPVVPQMIGGMSHSKRVEQIDQNVPRISRAGTNSRVMGGKIAKPQTVSGRSYGSAGKKTERQPQRNQTVTEEDDSRNAPSKKKADSIFKKEPLKTLLAPCKCAGDGCGLNLQLPTDITDLLNVLLTHVKCIGHVAWILEKYKPVQRKQSSDERAARQFCTDFFENLPRQNDDISERMKFNLYTNKYIDARHHRAELIRIAIAADGRTGEDNAWDILPDLPEQEQEQANFSAFCEHIGLFRRVAVLTSQNKRKNGNYDADGRALSKTAQDILKEHDFLDDIFNQLHKAAEAGSDLFQLTDPNFRQQILPKIQSLNDADDDLIATVSELFDPADYKTRKAYNDRKNLVVFRSKIKLFVQEAEPFLAFADQFWKSMNDTVDPVLRRKWPEEPGNQVPIVPPTPEDQILQGLENKWKSNNAIPMTFALLQRVMEIDVRCYLDLFLRDPQQTIEAAVQQLTCTAATRLSGCSDEHVIILGALTSPIVWRRMVFNCLENERRSAWEFNEAQQFQPDPEVNYTSQYPSQRTYGHPQQENVPGQPILQQPYAPADTLPPSDNKQHSTHPSYLHFSATTSHQGDTSPAKLREAPRITSANAIEETGFSFKIYQPTPTIASQGQLKQSQVHSQVQSNSYNYGQQPSAAEYEVYPSERP